MLSESIQKALNDQLNLEFFCAMLYLSTAAWCEKSHLCGFASWLHYGYEEELEDVCKIYHYMVDQGATIELQPVEAPQSSFESIIAVFQYVHEHELLETDSINKIYTKAQGEKDYATTEFLDQFISHQVGETKATHDILERLWIFGQDPAGLFMMDYDLGHGGYGKGKDEDKGGYGGKDDDDEGSNYEGKGYSGSGYPNSGGKNPGGKRYTGYGWGGDKEGGVGSMNPRPFRTGNQGYGTGR